MDIGSIWAAFRIDGSKAKADITKAAGEAGDSAGKTIADRLKASWSKENIGKGFVQGLGLAGGLGAAKVLSTGIGAVADAFTDSLNAANKFDDQLRTINTVAGVSDQQLHRIGDSIQQLSRETGQTTEDLTAGFYDLVSAGIPAEHAMDVLKNSAILATGALGTTGETVDLVTTTLNAFGLQATESGRVVDVFAKAVADGKVTAAELGATMANIAPIAASAGISLEEVAAGYAQLTKNGVPAAQAATQLRASISALLTPNAELAKIQKAVNINFADMARSEGLGVALDALRQAAGSDESLAKALGSVEALGSTLLITGDNAGAFAAELHGVQEAARTGGIALQQYTEKSKSAAEQQKRFDAEVQTLQQDIGELIQPIYKALVGGATLVIKAIRGLGQAFHDFERFLSPHLALIEDEDRALIDLAQKYGISEDALLSFADAQRKAADSAREQAQVVTTLQNMLTGMTDNDAKNTLVSSLTTQLQELADAAGIPIEQALFTLQGELGDTALTADNASAYMKLLAGDLGVVTDASGKLVPAIDQAKKILSDFLLSEGSTDLINQSKTFWTNAGQGVGEGLASGISEGVETAVKATTMAVVSESVAWNAAWREMITRSQETIQKGLRDTVNNFATAVVDMKDRVKTGKAGVIEQFRDLAWQSKHPFAEENYANWLKDKHDEAMRKAEKAAKDGKPGVAAQYRALAESIQTEMDSLPTAAAKANEESATALAQLQERVLALRDTARRAFQEVASHYGAGSGFLPGLASGGHGSGLTWVGEAGPELVDFSRDYVYPHDASVSMVSGGATSTLEVIVRDPDGGIARAGQSPLQWADAFADVLRTATASAPIRSLAPRGL